jgi:hypothetical protein
VSIGITIIEPGTVPEFVTITYSEGVFVLAGEGKVYATAERAFRLSNYAERMGAVEIRHDYDGSKHE